MPVALCSTGRDLAAALQEGYSAAHRIHGSGSPLIPHDYLVPMKHADACREKDTGVRKAAGSIGWQNTYRDLGCVRRSKASIKGRTSTVLGEMLQALSLDASHLLKS